MRKRACRRTGRRNYGELRLSQLLDASVASREFASVRGVDPIAFTIYRPAGSKDDVPGNVPAAVERLEHLRRTGHVDVSMARGQVQRLAGPRFSGQVDDCLRPLCSEKFIPGAGIVDVHDIKTSRLREGWRP